MAIIEILHFEGTRYYQPASPTTVYRITQAGPPPKALPSDDKKLEKKKPALANLNKRNEAKQKQMEKFLSASRNRSSKG